LVLNFGSGTSRDAIQALVCGLLGLDSAADVGRLEEGATTAAEAELVDAENVVFLLDLLGLAPSGQLRVLYEAMDNAAREAGRAATLVQLVRRTNRRQPRVLAIEDLHWADAATLDLLAPLAAAVVDCPALLIMTSRVEQNPLDEAWRAKAGGGPLLTIDIGPLHADEAGELAASFPAVDAALARSCIERAAGNPLYLEQLLRYAVEGDASKVAGTVQSLVQARLDRLDADDRLALQAASVLGQRFDREALAAVLDQPSYDSERFAAHHMVQPHGTQFLFAHALIHEAVYDSLLKSRRAELHRRAADHYAAFDPGLRAAHLDRAGDPQAARAYLAAAQREATEYHYAAAQALGRRGLELANEREDRFALASLLGEVLHDLGDMPAALASCQEALTAAGSDAERCRAWLGLAAVKRVTDDIDGALADLIDAEAAAVTHGLTHELARLHLLRGNLYFPSGDIERCLKEHGRSLELAERTGSAELEAAALGGLGDGEYMRGRMMTARDRFARCVRLCQDHGLVRIEVANRPMLAFAGWFAGDGAKAAAEAALAIEMAQSVAHHRAEMIGRHAACFISLALMNLDAAFEHAEAALALARGLRARRFEAEGLALRADVRRARGDLPEAARDAEAAVALSFETGPAFVGPFALGVLARTVTDQRRRQEAMAEADRLLSEGAVSHNHLLFRRDAIEMAIDADDWDSAEKYAAALEAYTRDEPLPWAEFYVRRARWLSTIAREGSSPEALAQLRELRAEGERRGLLHALARI
jgi:tetratricopeptide (TPR) repeat protein